MKEPVWTCPRCGKRVTVTGESVTIDRPDDTTWALSCGCSAERFEVMRATVAPLSKQPS